MSYDADFCREEPDERETVRLDLVGLAAEVATLSSRIAEELAGMGVPERPQLEAAGRQLAERALSVLDPRTAFEPITTDALREALRTLGADQQQLLQLRWQVAELRDRTMPCDLDLGDDPPDR